GPTKCHPIGLGERGFPMPQSQQLPGPNADIWDWQMHGLCRGVDSSMFFHPDGERGRARAARELRAKEMCRRCTVIAQWRATAPPCAQPSGSCGGPSDSEGDLRVTGGNPRPANRLSETKTPPPRSARGLLRLVAYSSAGEVNLVSRSLSCSASLGSITETRR